MTEPWLLVQEGSKIFLLAKDQRDYILISVNKNLTEEAEERLSRRAITPQLLTEMGLTFRLLPKDQIRGVALSGSEAGETIWFYPVSGKKQKYVFSDDYSREQTDAFFAGTARFTPPGNKKKKKDPEAWRLEGRNPAVYEKLWFVSPLLMGLNLVCGFGYLSNRNWQWYLAFFVCAAVPVTLDILYPAYFTLIPSSWTKAKARDLSLPLAIHALLVMVLVPMENWLENGLRLKVCIVCGMAVMILLGLLVKEFRKNKLILLEVLLLAGYCGGAEVQEINRVFDFAEPQAYILTVEKMEHTGDDTDNFCCFVTLPGGQEQELCIARDLYATLGVGDPIRVEIHPGALGIEYAQAYPIESTEGD